MIASINKGRAGYLLGEWVTQRDCGCGVTKEPGSRHDGFVAVVLDPPGEGGWRIISGPYGTHGEASRYVEDCCPHL